MGTSRAVSGSSGSDNALVGLNQRQEQVPVLVSASPAPPGGRAGGPTVEM